MKTTNVKTAKNKLSELLREAQLEHVVVMNHGRPVAVIVGVGGRDLKHVFDMDEDLTQLKVRIAKEAATKRSEHALSHEEMERLYLRKAPRPASSRRRKKAA